MPIARAIRWAISSSPLARLALTPVTAQRSFAEGRMRCVSDDGAVDAARISDDAASQWTNELDQLAGILGDGFVHAQSITH